MKVLTDQSTASTAVGRNQKAGGLATGSSVLLIGELAPGQKYSRRYFSYLMCPLYIDAIYVWGGHDEGETIHVVALTKQGFINMTEHKGRIRNKVIVVTTLAWKTEAGTGVG